MNPIVELAALLHPMPEPGTPDPDDILADVREGTNRKRKAYADDLEATAFGTDTDPLIVALQKAKADKEAADRSIRTLLAYAREFHPPRRYSLNELGGACGYTPSGVRTAYGDQEIAQVQGEIGRAPRRTADEGEGETAPQIHSCDNCDGVDPGTCLTAPKEH
ncbi:hypothetical protein [Streptomyces sp. NPDC059783]|uniref:hypothetical protein n=1 Tax=Streptomyces sp. NPDC059783 TaxID=3346944 RepID=UPI00365A2C6A